MAPPNEMKQRVEAVKLLLHAFRAERYAYLGISIIAFAILLIAAGVLVSKGHLTTEAGIGLFLPGGAITFTTARVLKMWSDAIRVLYVATSDDKEKP